MATAYVVGLFFYQYLAADGAGSLTPAKSSGTLGFKKLSACNLFVMIMFGFKFIGKLNDSVIRKGYFFRVSTSRYLMN